MRAGRWSGAGVAALALGVLGLLACLAPARADAFIYWAAQAEGDPGTIGRANNDGTAVDRSFIPVTGNPCGVAVDGGHLYWGNTTTRAIGWANLDGSGVDQSFVPGASAPPNAPCGVAVDGSNIWWANFSFSDPGSIGRADIDGSDAQPSLISGGAVDNPLGVAVRAGLLYWTNPGATPETIGRSGAPPPPVPVGNFVPDAGDFPAWPAVNASHVYWGRAAGGILRADLNGMNVDFVTPASSFGGVATHGTKLYFANNTEGTIGRANLDGSSPQFAFITGAGQPAGLAVDSGSTPPVPPNGACDELTLGKAKKNKKKGTAKLAAEVGCAGTLELAGKGVKPAEREASGPGEVKLPVKAKGKKKKKLRKKGKTKLGVEVTFSPTDGDPVTEDAKLKLVKKK